MLNLNSILIFSEDPSVLVKFYKKIFQKDPNWSGGNFHGFEAGSSEVVIGPHGKVKGKNTNPERMMFNLETNDVKGEFDRIKGLDAQVVQEPYQPEEAEDAWIATFADPDGNYFQLMSPFQ